MPVFPFYPLVVRPHILVVPARLLPVCDRISARCLKGVCADRPGVSVGRDGLLSLGWIELLVLHVYVKSVLMPAALLYARTRMYR